MCQQWVCQTRCVCSAQPQAEHKLLKHNQDAVTAGGAAKGSSAGWSKASWAKRARKKMAQPQPTKRSGKQQPSNGSKQHQPMVHQAPCRRQGAPCDYSLSSASVADVSLQGCTLTVLPRAATAHVMQALPTIANQQHAGTIRMETPQQQTQT